MTTHTGAQYEADFNKDYAALQTASEQYQADATAEQGYVAAYKAQWQAVVSQEGHVSPWTLLILFMSLMANQGSNQLNERLAMQGDQLQCQTDLGKLNNDITNMVNDTQVTNGAANTQLPSTPDPTGNATQLAIFAAQGLNKILYALSPTIQNPAGNQAWYADLQNALTSQGASNLFSNFHTLREQFYLGDNTSGGDPYDPTPSGTGQQSFSFDLSSAGNYLSSCFNSFSELHRLAAQPSSQGSGAPNEATTVLSTLSTPLNTNTSMLQSTQAESNQYISMTTNIIKTIESAISNFGHGLIAPMQTANQNMSK